MGEPSLWVHADRARLRRRKAEAARELPAAWLTPIAAEAKREAGPIWHADIGQAEVWEKYLAEFGGAASVDLSDAGIKARASQYADEAMTDHGMIAASMAGVSAELSEAQAFCQARSVPLPLVKLKRPEVGPPDLRPWVRAIVARVRCPYWWRRALRRLVARKCERGAMALGLVSKPAGQPYASNSAVWRRIDQNARNASAAENIFFENDAGAVASLAELAARSTSNKAIRRGELMTRIRGCEQIADECGHVGLFLTLTLPSRFHSTLRNGARNPKHDGSDPRAGQAWLCAMWARARAKLKRKGVGLYGFRVAEPHHDGCVHWHALLWAETEAGAVLAEEIIRSYWLSDAGDEPGARKYRIACKRMEKGGAAGYVAKYISKNIDDHGITDHLDDYAESAIGPDLLGDQEIKPSMRVEAWAAAWGVRQFQPIGQPPVGVWRELRRVQESAAKAAGFKGIVHRAWLAAQRNGAVLADWARYVKAVGGVMTGRSCFLRVRREAIETDGLYGRAVRLVPVGVALNVRGARTIWSERRLWRSIESSAATAARASVFAAQRGATRTRVNNCTGPTESDLVKADFLRGKGGQQTGETACPVEFNSPQPSARPPITPPMRT